MIEEKVYSSICPGCGLGCGLYIREKVEPTGDKTKPELSVDFRKNAPVNAGKLCRFGMNLPIYYGKIPNSKVKGKKSSLKEAVAAAAKALKAASKENMAFLSVGMSTNEEQLAFSALAKTFSCPVETGMEIYAAFPETVHKALGYGTGLEEIEASKQVFLFIDPYVSYPLVLRRVLKAKRKGAKVTAVGPKSLPLADENLSLEPAEYGKSLAPTQASILLSDLHPYSDPTQIKAILELAETSGAKLLFLRPFVNSKGATRLAKHTKQRSFEKLLKALEAGEIKTLFCLDSDLSELSLDPKRVKKALSNLDTLIVQASRSSPLTEFADIVIGAEPFYQKKGSVLNAEGRLLKTGGDSILGFKALAELAKALGKEGLDFAQVQKKAFSSFGLSETDEFKPEKAKPISCGNFELRAGFEKKEKPKNTKKEEQTQKAHFSYNFTPFMWQGLEDDCNFVELNIRLVQKLGLSKGGSLNLKTPDGETQMRFKVSALAEGVVLSEKKIKGLVLPRDEVELSR
ncbi:MAG: hypothetical protein PHD41_02055 [Methanosarcinaceae archaeon]|nr:hypothetical protein [Methanosarcinaceae archaeon]